MGGNKRKTCYPQGCDAWADVWIERAENNSAFEHRAVPTKFYTQFPNKPKTLLQEVDLSNDASTLIDTDGDGTAEWIIIDEPGFLP